MDFITNDKSIDAMIDQLFNQLYDQIDLGEVCRSSIDRPLDNQKYSLWSDGASEKAYETTTTAWDSIDHENA